jgi:hypothetical protein
MTIKELLDNLTSMASKFCTSEAERATVCLFINNIGMFMGVDYGLHTRNLQDSNVIPLPKYIDVSRKRSTKAYLNSYAIEWIRDGQKFLKINNHLHNWSNPTIAFRLISKRFMQFVCTTCKWRWTKKDEQLWTVPPPLKNIDI